jgi:hypothetical protein
MAKIKIFKKDGSPTPYYWSDKDNPDRANLTVFKKTVEGIKRMTGVHFDANKNKFVKE